jgi:amino acid adenylation domain-containing protein
MLGESASTELDRSTLLRTHYALQAGGFLTEVEDRSGGIFAFSENSVSPLWNHAAWVDGTDAEFGDFLRAASAWHNQERRPAVYVVDPSVPQLRRLEAEHYERFDAEAWLISRGKGKRSSRVAETAKLQDYLEVFGAVFGTNQPAYEKALYSAGSAGHRHFVLYCEEKAVAIGTFAKHQRTGCLYNIGTLPSARKQGFAKEMVEHLVAFADEQGCDAVFLQVERGSAANGLYEKLGFFPAFTRIGLRLTHWAGRETHRTALSQLLPPVQQSHWASIGRETRALPAELLRNGRSEGIMIAAWAYLLHRYMSADAVVLWLGEENGRFIQKLDVTISRSEKVSGWVARLPTSGQRMSSAEAEHIAWFTSGDVQRENELGSVPLELHMKGEAVQIVYREDVFSKEAIRRMASHYVTTLESLITSPGSEIKDIEILSSSERRQLLLDWNQSQFESTDATVARLFEEQVERTPEGRGVSLASISGADQELTYRQLNRRANRLAHRLQELGVGPEVTVGMLLDRSLDCIVALLAILKSGGVFVPLDPESPPERTLSILRDADAKVLVTDRQHATDPDFPRNIARLYIEKSLEHLPHKNPGNRATPDNAAYLLYTSGSTGTPKGVVVTHKALANHCVECQKQYGISSKDRVLEFSAFHFDASLEQILPALTSGAALIVRGREVWTPGEFSQILTREQITVMDVPTAYWHELVDAWDTAAPQNGNCLRLAIVGGDALSTEKVDKWERTPFSKARLINAYGPTEATITATSFEISAEEKGNFRATVPIGRPRGNRRAYVLDSLGRLVPIGLPGELYIGGPLLARGYHRQPEQTLERFIADPFSDDPEARLYKTGDLVRYREDGTLEFLGRVDDQIKIRGFRIELGEVEAALRGHPYVRDALVIARVTEGGERRLIGYTVGKAGLTSEAELKGFLAKKLPGYMVPSRIMPLENWPVLANGKIDRGSLPVPDNELSNRKRLRGPRDPLELQLQLLFERVLKCAPIGVDQSFFELGGDSLQALELLVQVEKETSRQLPLATLYQAATVEAVARELRGQSVVEQWSSLVPLQARGSQPPLYLLHTTPGDILGYGNLVYRLGPERPCYGFQSLGLKDTSLCHTSIEEMARYYVDLLRRFQPHGPYYLGGWCYGGILALEMARLLKAQGEPIGLLALLETVAMPADISNYRYYAHRLRCFLKMSPARWILYAHEKRKYHRNARLANRMRFREVDAGATEQRDARLAQLEHVYNTNLTALNRYRSSYYDGTVTLFNAAQRDNAVIPDPEYGWVGLSRQIKIYQVPGNHDTMLAEPNVAVLAKQLNEALEKAQHKTPRP